MNINSLHEIIGFNEHFKTSINLYLNLNDKDKIRSYIPTKSSIFFLRDYLRAIKTNKEQSSILIGPYGKGKSHLLLVVLAILSLERSSENKKVIWELKDKISKVDDIGVETGKLIEDIWNNMNRFLPVIISNTQNDLSQAFLYALKNALKREDIKDLIPDTSFSLALKKIDDWKKNYKDTYTQLEKKLSDYNISVNELKAGLTAFSRNELNIFIKIYPLLTSGGEFNPMTDSSPLSLYKEVSNKLAKEYKMGGIYIVFDEFSKYIESQDKENSGNDMKLLQDMCELANNSDEDQIRITMVAHKSIKEYGKHLSAKTINAFTGIEGRLVEKLYITSSKNSYELIKNAIIHKGAYNGVPEFQGYSEKNDLKSFYDIPAFRGNFDIKSFTDIVFKGCFPLNPIAAFLLLNISEKVAQNERTLFTFISNDEPNSMRRYVSEHSKEMPWSIGADLIYDYFANLFKKEITNEHVHNEWLNAEYAISKCTNDIQRQVVKAVAAFLIANKDDELPATSELIALSVGESNAAETIEQLVDEQIIYVKESTNSLAFKTRAGSALRKEIKKHRGMIGDTINFGSVFEHVTGKYYVIPRRYNIEHAMTRYFRHEYMSAENFLNISQGEVLLDDGKFADGKVISLFSASKINQSAIKKHVKSLACDEIVVVCPEQRVDFSEKVLEYEILQSLKQDNVFNDDKEIMQREMKVLEEELSTELEIYLNKIYNDEKCKVMFFDGNRVAEDKSSMLESVINGRCERIYSSSPLINNEMINRESIPTGQTRKARTNIIQAILEYRDDESYYEGTNQEATLYRSMLVRTGVKDNAAEANLNDVLNEITNFIDSCAEQKNSIASMVRTVTDRPYGLRRGVLPVYFAYLIANRNEDIVVYKQEKETQLTAEVIVDMCENPENYALLLSKEDFEKEKYIEKLNALFSVADNRNLSPNRIKNISICMQRWFRALPQVTRNAGFIEGQTKDVENRHLSAFKKLLQQIEPNPYELLFSQLPETFGAACNLEKSYKSIEKCKAVFDGYLKSIIKETIAKTRDVFNIRKNQDVFHGVKEWYESQSEISKNGLHGGRITNFMSCIEKLNVYGDEDVIKKIVKAVTDVYIENWNEDSLKSFSEDLTNLKAEIESMRNETESGTMKLSFVGKNGNEIEKFYEHATEGSGKVLRNIIEDTLDEYDDLSVNDRVAILLEMIEKVIG